MVRRMESLPRKTSLTELTINIPFFFSSLFLKVPTHSHRANGAISDGYASLPHVRLVSDPGGDNPRTCFYDRFQRLTQVADRSNPNKPTRLSSTWEGREIIADNKSLSWPLMCTRV